MTRAICFQCGASKVGALTACPNCSFAPSTPEEQAKSITLSDHHLTPDRLDEMGQQISSGGLREFDLELVAAYADQIRNNPRLTRPPLGCLIAVAGFALVGLVLVAILAFYAMR